MKKVSQKRFYADHSKGVAAERRTRAQEPGDRRGLLAAVQNYTQVGVNPCRWTGGVAWIDQSAASSCMNTLELLGRHVAQRGV